MSSDSSLEVGSDSDTENWHRRRSGSNFAEEEDGDEYERNFKWAEHEAEKTALKELRAMGVFDDDDASSEGTDIEEPAEGRRIPRTLPREQQHHTHQQQCDLRE